LAGADNFGAEDGKAGPVVEWMNAFAKKNSQKFEARPAGYSLQTVKFGSFAVIVWSGEWSLARNAIRKASVKLNARVLESGYHEKRGLLAAMLGGSEYAKVYSSGKLVGKLELDKKSGRWIAKSESYV
jgi:hypothetical protein